MWRFVFWVVMGGMAWAADPATSRARTRIANGFDQPVGKPDGEGYYMFRGFRAKYHMGEDWNGLKGGDSDLGAPVYSIAHGIVVMARDLRMGWGNLVIIRHIYLEEGKLRIVDSVYAHLDKIMVRQKQQIVRGQQIGTIGTAHGLYTAHLHFEIRKNLHIGFNQRGFGHDLGNYFVPGAFINARRKLSGGGRSALVPVDTFNVPNAVKSLANEPTPTPATTPAPKKEPFRVKRY